MEARLLASRLRVEARGLKPEWPHGLTMAP